MLSDEIWDDLLYVSFNEDVVRLQTYLARNCIALTASDILSPADKVVEYINSSTNTRLVEEIKSAT